MADTDSRVHDLAKQLHEQWNPRSGDPHPALASDDTLAAWLEAGGLAHDTAAVEELRTALGRCACRLLEPEDPPEWALAVSLAADAWLAAGPHTVDEPPRGWTRQAWRDAGGPREWGEWHDAISTELAERAQRDRAEPPVIGPYRLTVPAREALQRAGNTCEPRGTDDGHRFYRVVLRRPPVGLVECLIGEGAARHRGLRLAVEPEYPGEWPERVIAWHEQAQWLPCPACGSALVWFEAGYVPGYRLCTEGHHVQVSSDGRSAALAGGAR